MTSISNRFREFRRRGSGDGKFRDIRKEKGDRRECANYRGISILSIPGKIYGRVFIRRVVENNREEVV